MDKPTPLAAALEEARRALGSEEDLQRLRAKLGELPPVAAPEPTVAKSSALSTKVAIGAVAVAAVIACLFALLHDAPRAAQAPQAPQVAAPIPQAAAPAPAPIERAIAPDVPAPPRAPEPKLSAPRRKAAAATQITASDAVAPALPPSVPKELELLTAAQDAIDGAPQRALGLLDEHVRLYPNGSFALEREALAIDALRKLGRTTAAQARARAFITRFPKASNAKHLQRWLDKSSSADHKPETSPLPSP